MLTPSTPIPCRVCDLMRPLWHRLAGKVLPGERCKCIRLGGPCEKIAEKLCGRPIPPEKISFRKRSH